MNRPIEPDARVAPRQVDARIDDAARWASPGLLARRLRLQVMRPRDHLVLTVSAVDCDVVVGSDRVPRLKPVEGAQVG